MKKKLLIIIPIVVILAAAATALLLLLPGEQQEAELVYNEEAFGEYFRKYLFTMGNDPRCRHRLHIMCVDEYTHVQKCYLANGRQWKCQYVPVYLPHDYVFRGVRYTTFDDYGAVYHCLDVSCAVCNYSDYPAYQYYPYFRCKLNSPGCDGSCLGFSEGDRIEVESVRAKR